MFDRVLTLTVNLTTLVPHHAYIFYLKTWRMMKPKISVTHNMINKLRNRRGVTGLETATILVAFVITAAAFAFVILKMGFITAEKAQSVISSGMSEATSTLLIDKGVVANFANTTVGGDQSARGTHILRQTQPRTQPNRHI